MFALSVWYVIYKLRVTFRAYDDEGYVLLSLKHYLAGGKLYGETYTQYGPFYFFAQEFWFRLLNLPVNHDTGRLITLVCWIVAALLGAGTVYYFHRNLLLASSAFAACVSLAFVLASEPGHPQQIVLVLLGSAVFIAAWAVPRWNRIALLLLGVVGSALAFTKINVGGFYFIALAHALACSLPRGRLRSVGVAVTLFAALTLPGVLMSSHASAVGRYWISYVLCAGVTFSCGALWKPQFPLASRLLLWPLAGALAGTAAIVLATISKGVSLPALVQGTVLDPTRQPDIFFFPLRCSSGQVLYVALGSAVAAGVAWCARRGLSPRFEHWIGALRVVAGVCAIPLLEAGALLWVLPIAPLIVIPTRPEHRRPEDSFLRLFLAALAVMQTLQTYPVAGSQVWIASWPVLLCAFLSISDGLPASDRREAVTAQVTILVLGIVFAIWWLQGFRPPFSKSRGPSLRGSSMLALEPREAARYRWIADRVQSNCDVLFTMPGMGSLNFWSGVDTPDGSNLTAWVQGLSAERQDRILTLLRVRKRACVVYNRELLRFWQTPENAINASPLAQYILWNMVKVSEREGYEIRVQPWRTMPWIER